MRLARLTPAVLALALVLFFPAGAVAEPDDSPAGWPRAAPDAETPGAGTTGRSAGEWSVEPAGAEAWTVTWTAPEPLPMTSDRPVIVDAAGAAVVTAVTEEGTGVRATLRQTDEPDPGELAVTLSGRVLDETPDARTPARAAATSTFPVGARALADDPATAGPFAVSTSDYVLPSVRWPSYRQPIEMVGHLVTPAAQAATGPRPLVVFLHGRHDVCWRGTTAVDGWPCRAPAKEIESHLGYDYLQRRLASQGYATVSLRVNGINAQDDADPDGGAAARAMIVARHLDHLAGVAAAQRIDLSRVVLIGHSRGGEGVNRAAIQIPLTAPYRVVGQVLLAPTDFGGQSAPYVSTVTVLPSCDGDVSDLQGQQFTDVSRGLIADDTSLKSSVLMVGANHNFFNTEWTPGSSRAPSADDQIAEGAQHCGPRDPNRLNAPRQRAAALAVVTGAVKLFASAATQYLPLFDGSDVRVASAGTAALRSHALGGGRVALKPGENLLPGAVSRASVVACRGTTADFAAPQTSCGMLGDELAARPHWYDTAVATPRPRTAFRAGWSAVGGSVRLNLRNPLDLTGSRLALRAVADQRFAAIGLKVAVTDGSGRTAVLTPTDGARLPRLPGGALGVQWAQSVIVDPTRASGVDLRDIRSLRLDSTTANGGLHLLDVETVPAALPAVPRKRAPLVHVGQVVQPEGHGPGRGTARVPVTVTGTITTTSRLYLSDPTVQKAAGGAFLTLAPGQRSASLPISYRADRRWGGDVDETVVVMPESGVMTTQYIGGARIVEDDPRPRLTLEPVATSVKEGGVLKVRARLSAPMASATYVFADFQRTQRPELRTNDVRRKAIAFTGRRAPRLSRSGGYVGVEIPAGRTTGMLVLPTVKDRRRESTEYTRLRAVIDLGDLRPSTARRTLRVTNR